MKQTVCIQETVMETKSQFVVVLLDVWDVVNNMKKLK